MWCHRCIQLQLHHVMQIYFWADLLVWHSSFFHLSIWWRLHNKSLKNFPLCILTVPTQRENTRTKGLASEARKAARSGTPKRATTTSPASEPRSPTDAEPKGGRRAKEAIKMWVTFTNCVYDYLMNFVFFKASQHCKGCGSQHYFSSSTETSREVRTQEDEDALVNVDTGGA